MIIALIGPDGAGKSTYVDVVMKELNKMKFGVIIRYPFNYFLLRKVLNFFKSKKSNRPKGSSMCVRYNKKFIFKFWPFVALIDNWIDYIVNLHSRNKIIVCDRYYYDLATSFSEFGYTFKWLYKFYLLLIPKPDLCIVFEAAPSVLQNREIGDFHDLPFFIRQRSRYLDIAKKFSFPIINTSNDLNFCCKEILKELRSKLLN